MILYTVIDQQVRNGSFDSSSKPVPATDPATGLPVASLSVAGTMSDDDAKNPANSLRFVVKGSWDGGVSFQAPPNYPFNPYQWVGGIGPKGTFTTPSETGLPIPVDANGVPAGSVLVNLDTLGNEINAGVVLGFSS